jgi:alpha-L-fucosidase
MNRIILAGLLMVSVKMFSQAIYEEERYVPETDSLVLEKLDEWQGKKFGLLMHWGTYSQWGIVESWSLCPEDHGWCERTKGANSENYFEYKKEYEGLKNVQSCKIQS